MFPVSDLMIRISSRKRLVRTAHQVAGFVLHVTRRSRPAYRRPALCDYCESWELGKCVVTYLVRWERVICQLSLCPSPSWTLDVVRRRLRDLM